MCQIRFVTDSTACFYREYAEEKNINIVPLSLDFSGRVFDEGFPGDSEEFYENLKASRNFPKTSQPSIGKFVQVFQDIVEEGDEVIAVLISSKLSGTYNAACIAAEMVGSEKISVIDSETTVFNLKYLVEKGYSLAVEGRSRNEIVDILNKQKKNMGISVTVDTLDYLKKGGRLSGAQAFIGSILNVKPVIELIDGKLVPTSKTRGKVKALEVMISRVPDNAKSISILHIFSLEEAMEVKRILSSKFKQYDIKIDMIGPVIGSHLGPKALGICYVW